ncbi:MAG: ATP-binding protein [Candidatus Xenobiia bacterium LiM19]
MQKYNYMVHENKEIDLPLSTMAGTLKVFISDLLIISEKNEIQNILGNDNEKLREALGLEFFSHMKRSRIFKEICLIDLQGHELVKAVLNNNEPVIIPSRQLTLRNDQVTLSLLEKLNNRSLFISPIEPVVHNSASPGDSTSSLDLGKLVYDRKGRKKAVLLIQYYAKHILEEFKRLSSNSIGDMLLLDGKGRLITEVSPQKSEALGRSEDFTIKYSGEWKRIADEEVGQFVTKKGIFTFRTIYPLRGVSEFQSRRFQDENPLILKEDEKAACIKIVSVISPDRMMEPVYRFSNRILILDILILIPLAALSWLFARTKVIRIKAEEALKESEARYSTVVENAKDGVIVVKNDTIVFANRAMEIITGFSNDELTGIPFTKLMLPECRNVMDSMKIHECQSAPVYEARLCGINDNIRDVEISSDHATVKGESVTIAIIRDITDRKKAEAEVKKLRDEFIYTLVHDMKGPLTSVNAYLKLISDPRFGEISDQKIGFIDIIKSSLDLLLSMINNITNASRLDEGMMEYNLYDWRIAELFDELQKTFEALAFISSIKLTFDYDPDLWIHGDKEKLRDVFHNLISNAFRYTSKGGAVTITVREREKDCEVRVSDTGYGIPEADLGNLFKKFSQVKGERQGTGLGLYIVKSIIEAHGSNISVESAVGKGTTFIFTLTRAIDRKTAEVALQKIMLVCDDEGVTALLSGVLKQDGFPVIHETSGKAALLKIADERPALILIYQKIAETDIVTFGKEYRKNTAVNSAPTLLIASGTDSEWEGLFSRIVPLPLNVTHFRETKRELLGIEVSIKSL